MSVVINFYRLGAHQFDKKPLPAITFCPLAGFKQKGFHYKVTDLLSNTLELSEIFNNFTLNEIANHIYEEPLAQQFGHCFSYYSNEEFQLNSGKAFYLKTGHDIKVFIHPKGDALWFTGFWEFPYEVSSVTLDVAKQLNFSFASLDIKEIRSVQFSKPGMPCADRGAGSVDYHEEFIKCCKESLWKNLPPNITCTVADMKQVIPKNSTMPECSNRDDADRAYWEFNGLLTKFTPKLWKYGCPVPCQQIYYQLKLDYYHKNNTHLPASMENISDEYILFYPYWSYFPEEERIESLEYDLTSLLVSAGGNLGLFLGFSCLSVFFGIIDWIRARF